jgi:hypothetical protein
MLFLEMLRCNLTIIEECALTINISLKTLDMKEEALKVSENGSCLAID